MSPSEERFKANVTVLIESVRHQVEEKAGEFFPKVREVLGRKALQELGETLDAARKTAPTHPRPKAPDEPPGNLVANPAVAATDRAKDKGGLLGRRRR
jgi:hypothetical protein